ncbi:tRNA dihydrouridine synthase DusB [candidate division KSB3 bacterium]|uniref:tRNA-dihydrouridine synthase n=1 Tax=candidate division KSB3 bacterium TaxID=2044937 RepID=A0A2G6KA67_9BACT|nr:MAG: tRNA dihydrouridine synthase DusB [candidate division KSB3 bacterium]
MMTFGTLSFDTNIFLAPLSGCSDLAFRLIARECGAKYCFFEMVDAHSMLGPHPRKFQILKTIEQDQPLGAQLVGESPCLMRDAAQILLDHVPAVSVLDINSACPVKKVVKKQAGAGLLNHPQTLFDIVRVLAGSVSVPVTVKLRIGYSRVDLPYFLKIAKGCEDNGAAALFVHGRTREQGYSGDVNYEAIRAVKNAVSIPVIGSGNVFSPQLAQTILDETGCDGILVARGAFGNPWIFRHIEEFFENGTILPTVATSTRKTVLQRHLAYIREFKSNSPAGKIGFMRKVTLWYLKGFPNAAKVRGKVNTVQTYDELLQFIDEHL